MEQEEVAKRFTHRVPDGERKPVHEEARAAYKAFADQMNELLPESREKSLAFTALEESSFWAHAAVARNMGGE